VERLDKSHWTLLAALARNGTLSAAAASLRITQSAASQRLREAERRLGVVLVVRTGKTLNLNTAGERIARAGEELSRTLADAIWIGRRRRERLRLAVGHHDSTALNLALIQQLYASGAGFDIEVLRSGTDETAWLLNRNVADAALLPAPPQMGGITSQALVADRLVAVEPADDPLACQNALRPIDFKDRTTSPMAFIHSPAGSTSSSFVPATSIPQTWPRSN
jgi:LysR family transcriptional regulator for metE and metH